MLAYYIGLATFLCIHASATNARSVCPQPFNLACDGSTLNDSTLVTTERSCKNAVHNPSFESASLEPWSSFATGSWAQRDIVKSASSHTGYSFYHGLSNSTNASSITLSQLDINVSDGSTVECSAWVRAGGNMGEKGTATFDVYLDGVSCGSGVIKAGDNTAWRKVGKALEVGGDMHMLAIVVVVDAMGEMGTGIEVGVDDVAIQAC